MKKTFEKRHNGRTPAEIGEDAAKREGQVSDEKNPVYLFQTTDTSILLAIARDQLDPVKIAKRELARRGLGSDGQWIGFRAAKDFWNLAVYRNNKLVVIPGKNVNQ